MTTVFDVARYVLRKLPGITTMKLQKLVYYCQAWSLVWDEIPLFEEDFEAWANGPVCPQLFAVHRGSFVATEEMFNGIEENEFNQAQIETMDKVIEYYGDKTPHWLSELTHKERPWKEARKGVKPGYPSNNVITKESMQDYYGGLIAND